MKLRVYLDLSNAVTRRRVAALLWADGEMALVGTAADADLVVSERVVATAAPAAVAVAGAALTARELEVLRLVAPGLSNKEIAPALGLTPPTVKNHLPPVLEKLDLPSRTSPAGGIPTSAVRGWPPRHPGTLAGRGSSRGLCCVPQPARRSRSRCGTRCPSR